MIANSCLCAVNHQWNWYVFPGSVASISNLMSNEDITNAGVLLSFLKEGPWG